MLRGVNRQIIEVNETKNEYFEKAILFVRPEYIEIQESCLRAEADKTVEALGLGSVRLRGRSRPAKKLKLKKSGLYLLALSCAGGAVISAAIFALSFLL